MADVEIMQTVSEVKKTKKVKKTSKRRESEVQITEVEQTNEEKGYVSFLKERKRECVMGVSDLEWSSLRKDVRMDILKDIGI